MLIIALILILGVILISGYIYNSTNQPNNNQVSGHFENQYVKFDLPVGVTAQDISNNTVLDIVLYKNGIDIGEISSVSLPPQARNAIEGINTTFADKKAVELNDEFGSSLYIVIKDNKQGNSTGIWIEMDPGYQKDYEYIKNSFIIKKTP